MCAISEINAKLIVNIDEWHVSGLSATVIPRTHVQFVQYVWTDTDARQRQKIYCFMAGVRVSPAEPRKAIRFK